MQNDAKGTQLPTDKRGVSIHYSHPSEAQALVKIQEFQGVHLPSPIEMNMKNLRGIYWRWLQELDSYDFKAIHVAGKKTGSGDGLSRSSYLPKGKTLVFHTSYQGTPHLGLNHAALKEAKEQDKILRMVNKCVKGHPPKSKEDIRCSPIDSHVYHQHLTVLDVNKGNILVMTRGPGFKQEVLRILVPNQASSMMRSSSSYTCTLHPVNSVPRQPLSVQP